MFFCFKIDQMTTFFSNNEYDLFKNNDSTNFNGEFQAQTKVQLVTGDMKEEKNVMCQKKA